MHENSICAISCARRRSVSRPSRVGWLIEQRCEVLIRRQAGLGADGHEWSAAGAAIRLTCHPGAISTNPSLTFGRPVDYGITKTCDQCRICELRCPPDAIPARHREIYLSLLPAPPVNATRCMRYAISPHLAKLVFMLGVLSTHRCAQYPISITRPRRTPPSTWRGNSFRSRDRRPAPGPRRRHSPWLPCRGP